MSAIWNLAYDLGIGAGAFGFGVVAAQTGYPGAFAVTAALVLGGLVPRAGPAAAGNGALYTFLTLQAELGLPRRLLYTTLASSAAEKAYEAIRDGIVGGELPVGGGCARRSWPAASG